MGANEFHPRIGLRACISSGQFKGYEVEVVGVDEAADIVHVEITLFDRPVDLVFSFAEAADLLLPSAREDAELVT